MLISFLIFFALFSGVGIASYFWKKNTVDDYFLAGRAVPAWLVALSFGATISSGATFIGFAGLAYHSGIIAVISTAALVIGDHVGWILAGNKVRNRSRETGAHTYPSLIGKLSGDNHKIVTLITALLTVVFLGVYCAAQLVAGAKIGVALFDWDFNAFILLGAGILLAYCWAGGIRASIWTDTVQAIMIFVSLLILVVVGIDKIGGLPAMWNTLSEIDPALTNPFKDGMWAIAVGWFCFGVGILGQPQLMVRHMVTRSEGDLLRARRIYLIWRWSVLALACLSGMVARILIPAGEGFDPELSIPALWEDLLPPVLVGVLIAGLFSATMSTADSLLLSASSALTQHIIPAWHNSYARARLGTMLIMVLIVGIALFADKGVLSLVVFAWGGMASAIVPLVVVKLFGAKPSQKLSIMMIVSGLATAVLWRFGLELNSTLMDLIPGMAVGFTLFGLSHLCASIKTLRRSTV